MARKKKQTSKGDYQKPRAQREVPDSTSENDSPPARRISKRARPATDVRAFDFHGEMGDDADLSEENSSRPKRRRTITGPVGFEADKIATAVQIPLSQSLPSEGSNSLRRSNRGIVMKNGPQAYSMRWHPIDDLKSSRSDGRKNSQKKVETPDLKGSRTSPLFMRENSNERTEEQTPPADRHQISNSPRRRSSRRAYNADVAMRYDMSSHWSYRKLQEPRAFAKKLEQKRRALASELFRDEASDVQPETLAPLIVPKANEYKGGKLRSAGSRADTKEEASENALSRPIHSHHETVNALDNMPLSPHALLAVTSPAADSLMVLDEDLLLNDRDSLLLQTSNISTNLPKEKSPDTQFVQPPPLRKSPKTRSQPLDWNTLPEFDRRLYSLQKGAPIEGDTLPLQWPIVKQILFTEGWKEPLGSRSNMEDTVYIQNRYECIRRGVEAFFNAESEPEDKKNWRIFRVEGFNVYETKKGHKYWRRGLESVMKPAETAVEHRLKCPPSVTLVSHQGNSDRPMDNLLDSKEPDASNDIRLQDASATTTQIDKFLALAEPYEEPDSLLTSRIPNQGLASTTPVRDGTGLIPNAVGDVHAIHDQSERTLMDVMRMTHPNLSLNTAAMNMVDIEALLRESSSSQEVRAKPLLRPSRRANGTTSPAKRQRRNTTEECFAIFEDETADTDTAKAKEDQARPHKTGRERNLDLPVENMSAGELVPGSQERGENLMSRRVIVSG